MIHKIKDKTPTIASTAFIAWNAEISGDVKLGEYSSVWYGASVRGDLAPIKIGKNSNIQDNATLHVDYNTPIEVGNNVTVGHNAVLHGCKIKNNCLIGMGAIVLNNAEIGEGSIIGAGSVITEGKKIPPYSLVVGVPGKIVKTLNKEDVEKIKKNAEEYVKLANDAKKCSS